MVAGLILSFVLAAPPNAYVVLTKKSGVAAPRALEVVSAVKKRLSSDDLPVTEFEGAQACNGKKNCLLTLARGKNAVTLVLVELGAVLDVGIARVEALSVEEDGRSLGVVDHEGPLSSLPDDVAAKAAAKLLKPMRELAGLKEPEPVAAPPPPPPLVPVVQAHEPAPPVAQPTPVPVPVPVVEAPAPAATAWSTGRIAAVSLGAAGVATLAGALVEGIRSGGYGKQRDAACGAAVPCTDRIGVANANASTQTGRAAVILAIVGGGLVVAAGVVFGIDLAAHAEEAPAVSLVPVPGGAVVGFGGRF
jgi:hypothetical protein